MSLRFIYGRAGRGKSHFCLEVIKNNIRDGHDVPLILLVPEQFSFQSEKKLLRTVGEENILKAEVLSFRRMAYRVFNEVGGNTRQHMDASGRAMLLYRIMESMKGSLKLFGKAVRQQGFIDIVSDMIIEMKRYNVTPEILNNTRENIKDELLKGKLHDIGLIFEEFERLLHEKYIDSEDDLTILAEKLDKSSMFKGAEIWIDEFASFTPQEYVIISKLLATAARVNVTLCTDSLSNGYVADTDVFSVIKGTQLKLQKMAKDMGIKLEQPLRLDEQQLGRFSKSSELAHLEKRMFSFPYIQYGDKTKDISIFKSVNKYGEIEETARDIVRICRDKHIRYRDIGVVTRDLKGYESLIKAVFGEYGIPYFIDQKRAIIDNPLVLLITSAVETVTRNWAYEPIFRYLKTGLTGISQEDTDLLENYVLANGIRGWAWLQEEWRYRLNYGFESTEISEYEGNIIKRVNEVKNIITAPLMKFHKRVGKGSGRKICTALYEFLCDIEIPEKIEKLVDDFKAAGELELASEYSQIWNMIMGVLNQIVEVMGEEEMTLEQFLKILTQGLSEYEIGIIPTSLDQVLVGGIERLKSHEIKVLYIVGVNDGVFPMASKEEGILNDGDREYLKGAGVELPSGTKAQAFEEQFLEYTALTSAGEYLRLSYPIANHEGKSMRPSIIISIVKKLFPNINEFSNIVEDSSDGDIHLVNGPHATFKELISAVRKSSEGFEVSRIWDEVKEWYMNRDDWKDMYGRIATGLSYSNQVRLEDAKKVRRLYGENLYFSVSRLEKYVECPFSYFVQYGLRAKDRKVFEMSAPDLGTFLHGVIDSFSRVLNEKGMKWREVERDWCDITVEEIIDEISEGQTNSILQSSARYKYITTRLKRILARAVWLIAVHIKRSGFEPTGYEIGFGINGEFPPIKIKLSSGEEVNLIGRIDRVDRMDSEEGTYVRVVDYKSGNKAFNLSDVYNGLQIQLLVYLDAMLSGNQAAEKPMLPGGVLYFRVDDPIIKTKGELEDEEIEKEIMKKLKMRGLLLADPNIIREMDREIDGSSNIIPARINKDGKLGKSSAATLEQFEHLRGHVRNKLVEMCEEMTEGKIDISPYKKNKFTSCTYCKFGSVCMFDTSLKSNRYKIISDRKDDEIWQLISNGNGEGGGGNE